VRVLTEDGPSPAAVDDPDAAETAILALYRSDFDRFVRAAALIAGSMAMAEDAVQDAFVRVMVNRSRLRNVDRTYHYVHRTVVNEVRQRLRRQATADRYATWLGRRHESQTEAPDVVEAVYAVELLQTLSRREREVLVLRYYLDFSERDTAAALGIAIGTVKSHASRALARLGDTVRRESNG
jgi:RNA polymerase sigma factor (sigma-70 family)